MHFKHLKCGLLPLCRGVYQRRPHRLPAGGLGCAAYRLLFPSAGWWRGVGAAGLEEPSIREEVPAGTYTIMVSPSVAERKLSVGAAVGNGPRVPVKARIVRGVVGRVKRDCQNTEQNFAFRRSREFDGVGGFEARYEQLSSCKTPRLSHDYSQFNRNQPGKKVATEEPSLQRTYRSFCLRYRLPHPAGRA